MPKQIIQLDTWPRREHFQFFKEYDDPYWSATAHLDASRLYQQAKSQKSPFSLGYLFHSLKAVNMVEALRMRIEDGQPVVYDAIHASNTIARPNGAFGYSIHPYTPDLGEFIEQGIAEIERVQNESGLKSPYTDIDVIYYTVLRGVHFTSVDHPRHKRKETTIPLIAFGEMRDGKLPVAIHVNHALVDGQHVGQFFTFFQQFMGT